MATNETIQRIEEAAEAVRALGGPAPRIGLVLGSGLGAFADRLENARTLKYREIPHFPHSSVEGHAGELVIGSLRGLEVACMKGRVHGYEGYDASQVVFPIRVLGRLGVKALVLTNAAGCINPEWVPGDLMRMTDHINLSWRNPLVGPNIGELGPRFPDMSKTYDPRLGLALERAAELREVPLRAGVYVGLMGPSYETPAEIRMLRILGGDAVGMSTVGEAIAASHMGIPVAGISCLTNMAAGILDQPLNHEEVTETAARVREAFVGLLDAFLPLAVEAVGA